MSFALSSLIAVAAACALAAPISAQAVASHVPETAERIVSVDAHTPVAARPESAGVDFFISTTANTVYAVPVAQATFSAFPAAMVQPATRNVAMMVVGGAGLLVGAVVGGNEGTIIMIGGGGLGLVGLWQYLR